MYLFINKVCTSVGLAVFAQQLLDVFRIFSDPLLVAVIAIDEDYEVMGVEVYLCALVVGGRRAYATASSR